MKFTPLTVPLCLLFLPGGLTLQQFTVVPTPSYNETTCNDHHPCLTLDQLALNSTLLFREYDNYTLVFLCGVHVLTHELVIFDIDQLEMCADTSGEVNATIDFTNRTLTVSNVTSYSLTHLKVHAKGLIKPKLILQKVTKVYLDNTQLHNIAAVISRMDMNTINPIFSTHYLSLWDSKVSLEVINTPIYLKDLKISNSRLNLTITSKRQNWYRSRTKTTLFSLGGCKLFGENFIKMHITADNSPVKLDISNATVKGGGSGLNVRMEMEMWSEIESHIRDSNISQLRTTVSRESTLTLNISNCYFTPSETPVNEGDCMAVTQKKCSALYLNIHDSKISSCPIGGYIQAEEQQLTSVRIHNTIFFANNRTLSIFSSGVHLRLDLFKVTMTGNLDEHTLSITATKSRSTIQIKRSSFRRNLGYQGVCIHFLSNHESSLYLTKVSMHSNVDLALYPTVLRAIKCNNVTIDDSQFFNNTATPVEIVLGRIRLSRFVLFKENTARNGGGLSLISSSLVFVDNALITFQSNKVFDVGGAIFVSPNLVKDRISVSNNKFVVTITPCFFSTQETNTVLLNFRNNSAQNGGEDMYGTYLFHRCIISSEKILNLSDIRRLFKIQNSMNTSLSAISSDPKRVCICDSSGQPQCANLNFIYLNKTLYPGEMFTVSLVVVGEEFGTVTATTHATLLGSKIGSLGKGQAAQITNFRYCTNVEYSVHSSQSVETIMLTTIGSKPFVTGQLSDNDRRRKLQHEYALNRYYIENYIYTKGEIERQLLITPVYYNVTLDKCPLGFELVGDLPSCQCQQELLNNNIKHCTILNHTGYVYRSETTWVNATYTVNRTKSRLIVNKYCPYDYCLSENISVDLRYPDLQCALGHSGTLCGGCQDTLSLALGSNRCLDCPNSHHMSLLILFAVAGFVLVFFIKMLDLTVSKGTINGLIFYANIVWAEQSILFSNQAVPHKVINVFIAWLNLDFGIETCFAQGLTAYQKAWLQFLFPVYVWCIVGLIIFSSHYSTTATKLFGNNSVPVLATLFLMSYAKLLRTFLTVFRYTVLRSTDDAVTVWLYDGNVPYLGLKHSFLFTVTMLAVLFLWLPYIATLLLVPVLKGKAHYRPFRWIIKWKPFYDAYFGPLRVKHQYWIGALLVARVFLFVLFAATSASFPNLNLLVLAILTASMLVYVAFVGPIYKNKYLSLLENSFLLNLIFLSAGVLYQNVVGGEKDLVVYASVLVVFVQFLCITLYHSVVSLRSFIIRRQAQNHVNVSTICTSQPKRKKRHAFPLREELLESDNTL